MRFVLRRVAAAAALLVLVPAVLGALHLAAPPAEQPSASAFREGGTHLGAWARDMTAGYQVQAAVSGPFLVAEAPDPEATLLVVHAPRGPVDAAILDGHLARGGPVWILDPDGTTNAWLSKYGASVGPHRLVDPGSPHGAGTVRLGGADTDVLARSPATLVLDEDAGWETWLAAPAAAHLDLDSNGTVDRIDVPGPHAVGAARDMPGGGTLFVTADASILTDALRDGADNPDFSRWVSQQLLPRGGTIVVDESQHGWTRGERLPAAAVQSGQHVAALPAWAGTIIAIVVAGVAVAAARMARALRPYRQHRRSDPATAPVDAVDADASMQDAAWELLAIRTKQPVERLRKAGAAEAAHGLADDPALRRVLLGRGQGDDGAHVMRAFLHAQNPSRSNGVKP